MKRLSDLERAKILQAGQENLWNQSLQSEAILEYLRDKRHLKDEVIKSFRLGYAPRESQHDFAGRILMPLFDPTDELIAFTTRDISPNALMPHLHESFNKRRHLYGINVAKNNIRRKDKAIVVEGQFDAACFHSYGFNITVAACGTSFTIENVCTLTRYCSEIYLIFDQDDAGDKASESVSKLYDKYCLFDYNIKIYPAQLPKGYDPDDFVFEHGVQAVLDIMREAKEKANG